MVTISGFGLCIIFYSFLYSCVCVLFRPFAVRPETGTLGVQESRQIEVDFHAQDAGDHNASLQLHYDTGTQYVFKTFSKALFT